MEKLAKTIREIRGAMTQSEFGDVLGVSQGQISKWERKTKPEIPGYTYLIKIAKHGGMPIERLLEIVKDDQLVPVVGEIRQGAKMDFFIQKEGNTDFVRAPAGSPPGTVAARIDHGALGPLFAGWMVFYEEQKLPPSDAVLGKLCVACLADGAIYLRVLHKGGISGRYHLYSATEPPAYDAELAWATPVLHISQPI